LLLRNETRSGLQISRTNTKVHLRKENGRKKVAKKNNDNNSEQQQGIERVKASGL